MSKVNKNSDNGQTALMELTNTTKAFSEESIQHIAENGLPDDKPRNELSDIHYNVNQAKDRDYLNATLAQNPPAKWIKEHPMTKGGYIGIQTVEMLMRKIFQRFKTEVIDIKVIANAIAVHLRLHYIDPVTGEWDYQDGLGAVAIQVEKGASATDFTKTRSDAIQKNLPAAESYAFKDAAEKLGAIFGANLNRKDEVEFKPSYNKTPDTKWTKQ